MNTQMVEEIKEIIKKIVNYDSATITERSYLRNDLLIDSLMFIRLITEIEAKYEVYFESEKLYTQTDYTIEELVEYVVELQKEKIE